MSKNTQTITVGGYTIEPVEEIPEAKPTGRSAGTNRSMKDLIFLLKGFPGQWFKVHDDVQVSFSNSIYEEERDLLETAKREDNCFVRYNPDRIDRE